MEATAKIFVFLLLSCLFIGGNAQCKLSDLNITQTAERSHVFGGLQVYEVTVENRCICTQINVKVSCHGFDSSMRVQPKGVLRPDGDVELCTLNGGRPIPNGLDYAVKFSYTWTSQLSLKPVSSTLACSKSAAPAHAPAPFS